MALTGGDDDTRVPAKLVVEQMTWQWKMLRHKLMSQLPQRLIEDVHYAQAEEIVCRAVIELQASVRRPDGFGSDDGEPEGRS